MIKSLDNLHAMGFDNSYTENHGTYVRCSQCIALVLNGVACHETSCPNTKYECKGCNEILDYNGYCEDCN